MSKRVLQAIQSRYFVYFKNTFMLIRIRPLRIKENDVVLLITFALHKEIDLYQTN